MRTITPPPPPFKGRTGPGRAVETSGVHWPFNPAEETNLVLSFNLGTRSVAWDGGARRQRINRIWRTLFWIKEGGIFLTILTGLYFALKYLGTGYG